MAVRRPLPPWWIWVVGAILCLGVVVLSYAHLVWPLGWKIDRTSSPGAEPVWVVRAIQPDSPIAHAGLGVGDSIRGRDLEKFSGGLRPEGVYRLPVESSRGRRVLTVQLTPRDWSYWRSARGMLSLLRLGGAFVCLALAGVIVFKKPLDPIARWSAFFLGQLAFLIASPTAFGGVRPESFALVHQLGFALGGLAMVGVFLGVLWPATAFTFLSRFPRKPLEGRALAVLWIPALVTIPVDLRFWRLAHPGARGPAVPDWMIAVTMMVGASYLIAATALLLRNYRRLTDPNERRRTKILVIGLVITSAGSAVYIALMTPFFERFRAEHLQWLALTWPIVAFAAPIATAYAILRHRVFDVSVMVRLGLRYAAARGLLLSLVPLIGVGFVADVLLHGNQPLVEILRQRGWLYAGLAVAAYVLHTRRKTWLAALDRRFFREQYDAQQILGAVVEEVRRSMDFGQAAANVIARVESALHPEFAALLVHEAADADFLVVASTGMPPPALPSGSKLVSLVRVLGKPVEVPPGESGWVTRQLPPDESDFVRRNRIEWLFPISVGDEKKEALLLLGPKRSEEPYSKEDQDLVEAIAGSLAMLLERSVPSASKVGFEECSECGACYEPGEGLCTHDGVSLSRVAVSRTVDGRYRLDRRLGQGGMGTVYQAFDGELERKVAVKLIRPELVAGAEAAARFKWEAKAAGGFTHANVVTVHDFGVAEDGRAYTVMELLEGCTLRQEMERVGRFEVHRALTVMRGVCAAVSAAHERGLLHRDLKPENIFLTRSGAQESAKILDFGLVKQLAGFGDGRESMETTAGVLVGTLRYMAPEQLRGGSPSPGWDLWALAIVAYEMLVGRYPFDGPREIADLMASRRVAAIHEVFPEAPSQWQSFFEKALAADTLQRPGSAQTLFEELQAAVSVRPIRPGPPAGALSAGSR